MGVCKAAKSKPLSKVEKANKAWKKGGENSLLSQTDKLEAIMNTTKLGNVVTSLTSYAEKSFSCTYAGELELFRSDIPLLFEGSVLAESGSASKITVTYIKRFPSAFADSVLLEACKLLYQINDRWKSIRGSIAGLVGNLEQDERLSLILEKLDSLTASNLTACRSYQLVNDIKNLISIRASIGISSTNVGVVEDKDLITTRKYFRARKWDFMIDLLMPVVSRDNPVYEAGQLIMSICPSVKNSLILALDNVSEEEERLYRAQLEQYKYDNRSFLDRLVETFTDVRNTFQVISGQVSGLVTDVIGTGVDLISSSASTVINGVVPIVKTALSASDKIAASALQVVGNVGSEALVQTNRIVTPALDLAEGLVDFSIETTDKVVDLGTRSVSKVGKTAGGLFKGLGLIGPLAIGGLGLYALMKNKNKGNNNDKLQ